MFGKPKINEKMNTNKTHKLFSITVAFLIFFSFLKLHAQNNLPEFNDKPAYFNSKTNKITELEKSQYNTMAKAKGLFGAESGYFLNGVSSDVKIPKQPELKFVVKVSEGMDPTSVFDLVKFEVRKDKRIFITSKAKATSASTSFEKITYDLKKIKEGYYYLIVKDLDTGEYFLGSKDFMFAFSVE